MQRARLLAVRLSREGFGTPEQILRMPAPLALDCLEFCNFTADYEQAFQTLNKPE